MSVAQARNCVAAPGAAAEARTWGVVQTFCIINAIKGRPCLICISQPFALEMASKIVFDAQRNAAASFARISFACDGNRAFDCTGEETRDEKRV